MGLERRFYPNQRQHVKTFLAFFIAAANIRLRFEAAARVARCYNWLFVLQARGRISEPHGDLVRAFSPRIRQAAP
jgi:hypothetical protein